MNITASAVQYLSSSLSVNGLILAFDASKFNISQTVLGSGALTQVINFQYNSSDEGFYFHSLYFSDASLLYYSLRDQGHRCRNHRRYADGYLFLYPLSFAIFPFILTTYSK